MHLCDTCWQRSSREALYKVRRWLTDYRGRTSPSHRLLCARCYRAHLDHEEQHPVHRCLCLTAGYCYQRTDGSCMACNLRAGHRRQ